MNKQERLAICQLLSENTSRTYFYYANLSDEMLSQSLQVFSGQMVNNSAGEVIGTE